MFNICQFFCSLQTGAQSNRLSGHGLATARSGYKSGFLEIELNIDPELDYYYTDMRKPYQGLI